MSKEIIFTENEKTLPWVVEYSRLMKLPKLTDKNISAFTKFDTDDFKLRKDKTYLATKEKFKTALANLIEKYCSAISRYNQLIQNLDSQTATGKDHEQFTPELKTAYIEEMAFSAKIKNNPVFTPKKASEKAGKDFDAKKLFYRERYQKVLSVEDQILKNKFSELQVTEAKLNETHTAQQVKIDALNIKIKATIAEIREEIQKYEPKNEAISSNNGAPPPAPPAPLLTHPKVDKKSKIIAPNQSNTFSFADVLNHPPLKKRDHRNKLQKVGDDFSQFLHNPVNTIKPKKSTPTTLEEYEEKLKQLGTKIGDKMHNVNALGARNATQLQLLEALTKESQQLEALKVDFNNQVTKAEQSTQVTAEPEFAIPPKAPDAPPSPLTRNTKPSTPIKLKTKKQTVAPKEMLNHQDEHTQLLHNTLQKRRKMISEDTDTKTKDPKKLEKKRLKEAEEQRLKAEKEAYEKGVIAKYIPSNIEQPASNEAVVYGAVIDSTASIDALKTQMDALLLNIKNKNDEVQPVVEEENVPMVRQDSNVLRKSIHICLDQLSKDCDTATDKQPVNRSEEDFGRKVNIDVVMMITLNANTEKREKLLKSWGEISQKMTIYDVILMDVIKDKTLSYEPVYNLIYLRDYIVNQSSRNLTFADKYFEEDLVSFYKHAIEILLSDNKANEKCTLLEAAAHNDFRHRDSSKRFIADVLLLISCFMGVGLVIGGARKLSGNCFFFSSAQTTREQDFVSRLVRPVTCP